MKLELGNYSRLVPVGGGLPDYRDVKRFDLYVDNCIIFNEDVNMEYTTEVIIRCDIYCIEENYSVVETSNFSYYDKVTEKNMKYSWLKWLDIGYDDIAKKVDRFVKENQTRIIIDSEL